jgi:hypothetical protein
MSKWAFKEENPKKSIKSRKTKEKQGYRDKGYRKEGRRDKGTRGNSKNSTDQGIRLMCFGEA